MDTKGKSGRGAARGAWPDIWRDHDAWDRRRFFVWFVDGRRRVTGMRELAGGVGDANGRRALVEAVLGAEAAGFGYLESRPPGPVRPPTQKERQAAARLRDIGELLGIPLLDCLVFAAGRYDSLVAPAQRPGGPRRRQYASASRAPLLRSH